ncbi:MAG TPA: hypothetical protein H9948_06885 [Candidatus Jeotgalibaca merdavium]|uniref:Lipoprotein n=1 Tax=Candidatus Jeotgalibaca merdavium TaxID=2838627 RepID=A0A9D2I033_9LACT|nr:hypothetical protein [Candidatus Jeotgalibaca merdavium]
MKKLLFLLFASLLVLGACGQKEESSSKDETKDAKKEVKKEEKKGTDEKEKNSEKKTEEKSTEEVNSTEQQPTEDVNTTEQPTQEQTQQNEQTIQEQQDAYGKPSGQYDTSGPTYEEDENGNWKEIPKEDTAEQSYSADNPYMNLPDQEWRKNAGGLSSGEIQTRNAIKNGTYEGEDAEQVLEAINYYEQQYGQ